MDCSLRTRSVGSGRPLLGGRNQQTVSIEQDSRRPVRDVPPSSDIPAFNSGSEIVDLRFEPHYFVVMIVVVQHA